MKNFESRKKQANQKRRWASNLFTFYPKDLHTYTRINRRECMSISVSYIPPPHFFFLFLIHCHCSWPLYLGFTSGVALSLYMNEWLSWNVPVTCHLSHPSAMSLTKRRCPWPSGAPSSNCLWKMFCLHQHSLKSSHQSLSLPKSGHRVRYRKLCSRGLRRKPRTGPWVPLCPLGKGRPLLLLCSGSAPTEHSQGSGTGSPPSEHLSTGQG